MFPNGWPGWGLLVLRLVAGILLIRDGATELMSLPHLPGVVHSILGIVAGALFIAGLWTPMTGVLVLIIELWSIASRTGEIRNSIALAALGVALVMLGPGVQSIDARLFGRKRIDVREY